MVVNQWNKIISPERTGYNSPGQTECRPGFENKKENRPRDNVHKSENLISDEGDYLLFPENDVLQFRPKGNIGFVYWIFADGFSPASYTQASTWAQPNGDVSDRSSRNYAVPVPIISGGYSMLAFQARKISLR
jgi:hypothetical protein